MFSPKEHKIISIKSYLYVELLTINFYCCFRIIILNASRVLDTAYSQFKS